MYNEDRDHIIVTMLELIESALKKENIDIGEDFWSDELMDQFDDLFEPFSDGWRNYN